MASKSSMLSSELLESSDEQGHEVVTDLCTNLLQEKLDKNREKVQAYVSNLEALAASRNGCIGTQSHKSENHLFLKMRNPLCKVGRIIEGLSDKDDYNLEGVLSASVKLPQAERIPPYTTWIPLNRNQMMADDQSVIGKKLIYYERNRREPLICSDNEEELGAEEPESSEQEDCTEREAFQECAVGNKDANISNRIFGGTSLEIQEHSDKLTEKNQLMMNNNLTSPLEDGYNDDGFMEKSLSEALDSFDTLFCRRCLVFDCRLHGCPENVTYPREKQPFHLEEDPKPCGDQCYLNDLTKRSAVEPWDEHDMPVELGSTTLSPSDIDQALEVNRAVTDKGKHINKFHLEKATPNSLGHSIEAPQNWSSWKPLEKDLYFKGVEIFGRNSCYIARNMLAGFKTCKEVANCLYGDGGELDMDHMEPNKIRIPHQMRKSSNRKSSWRSGTHPSLRKIVNGKDQHLRNNYTPCGCQSSCGKQCPCRENGTSCEKSCGCSASCKNRFKGCSCAKHQCKSNRCPCVAAERECDPDICRNCWISCGDGSLGAPSRGPSGQCSNQNILLRKHQRILKAKSDVNGWGAYLKNAARRNDFLGEYTGELISHEEADKRGKAYDLANKSYLFNLNEEYVIDAYRMGNKFRFVNHSSNPNCYAKVKLVGGDHHVGIYAKQSIKAGEELLYDYGYDSNQVQWYQKPEKLEGDDSPKLKSRVRDDSPKSKSRAKKHQSM